jgi:hypothetical protein
MAWKQMKHRLVAKHKSASEPVKRDKASKVMQLTPRKMGGEKRDLG